MTKLALALTTLFLLYTLTSEAAEVTISSYSLTSPSADQLAAINKLFGIEHRRGSTYEIEVPAEQASLLKAIAPQAQLLEADVSAAIQKQLQALRIQSGENYHSFDQVQAWMHEHEKNHPELVKVINYGLSRGGRPLSALRIASTQSAGKPAVMITAATHGDELITTEVLLHLVNRLVDTYHKEDRLTNLVDSHEIYFVPVVNPDGFVQTARYDGAADPNRSYPYPGRENANPTPSIAGLLKFFSSLDVKASIDFHAYGEMIMYPWAYTHESVDPASRTRFDNMTRRMAEANRYAYGPISDVIYVAPGSSADYYFWKKGSLSLGIEMGDQKVPSPSEFPRYFESQEESTWRFLEAI